MKIVIVMLACAVMLAFASGCQEKIHVEQLPSSEQVKKEYIQHQYDLAQKSIKDRKDKKVNQIRIAQDKTIAAIQAKKKTREEKENNVADKYVEKMWLMATASIDNIQAMQKLVAEMDENPRKIGGENFLSLLSNEMSLSDDVVDSMLWPKPPDSVKSVRNEIIDTCQDIKSWNNKVKKGINLAESGNYERALMVIDDANDESQDMIFRILILTDQLESTNRLGYRSARKMYDRR